MSVPHMRLLKEASEEIKALDPGSAVTTYFIRKLALEGKIKSVMSGRKRLINFDDLLDYLTSPQDTEPVKTSKIRRIG